MNKIKIVEKNKKMCFWIIGSSSKKNYEYVSFCNTEFIAPNSNIYKILDVLRKQETLTANKFERVNLGNNN